MTDAIHDLIVSHRRFAASYALKLARGALMSECAEDAVSEAMVGLVEAAQRFDPGRGVSFRSFAQFHLLNRVGRFLAANRGAVRMPKCELLAGISIRMAKASSGLCLRLGRDPDPSEFAAELGVPVEHIQEAIAMRSAMPTALSTSGDFEEGRYAAPTDGPSPEELVVAAEDEVLAKKAVEHALAALKDRDADIVRSRWCSSEHETLTSIAMRHGTSRQYVHRLEIKALPKFERAAKAKAIELGWRQR